MNFGGIIDYPVMVKIFTSDAKRGKDYDFFLAMDNFLHLILI